jgi:hypothetical protein
VEQCGRGTLATLYPGAKVAFSALMCSSWSCSTCRKVKSARLLGRLRGGMESRRELNRIFLTLTINPALFGGRVIGSKAQEDGRVTNLVTPPTADQFAWATEVMSTEFHKLNKRLARKADRAGLPAAGYFRVIELHRSGWPHYHVVIEHPTWTAASIQKQLGGWYEALGRTDSRDISLDDAVGELAPYLTSSETKGGGTKTYQFAGLALPKGFRLHASSTGFLAPQAEPDEISERALVLSGHFHGHHLAVKEWGGDSRIVLHRPQLDKPHKPPAGAVSFGDDAVRYWLNLADVNPYQLASDEEAAMMQLEKGWHSC